jgi:hypothetical protein
VQWFIGTSMAIPATQCGPSSFPLPCSDEKHKWWGAPLP